MNKFRSTHRGFTLVELIAVLALLAVISAAAFSRFSSPSVYQSRILLDSLENSLRLAQRSSLSHHASTLSWRLTRTGNHEWQYVLLVDGSEQLSESVKAETSLSYSTPIVSGGTYTGNLDIGESLLLAYDNQGSLASVTDDSGGGLVNGALTITMDSRVLCVSSGGFAYASSCR
ncbi:MAG: pilus assembly FimT family protein [Pontibacterium sp.]